MELKFKKGDLISGIDKSFPRSLYQVVGIKATFDFETASLDGRDVPMGIEGVQYEVRCLYYPEDNNLGRDWPNNEWGSDELETIYEKVNLEEYQKRCQSEWADEFPLDEFKHFEPKDLVILSPHLKKLF